MKLMQASRLNGSQRGTACVANLLQHSTFLNALDVLNAFELTEHDWDFMPINPQTTALLARTLGTNYAIASTASQSTFGSTSTDIVPESKVTGHQYIHGGSVDVDASILADSERNGTNMNDWINKKLKVEWKKFAKLYQVALLNGAGTGTPVVMKGLSKLFDNSGYISGFSGINRIINAKDYALNSSPVSLDLTIGGTNEAKHQRAVLEMMNNVLADIENPNLIIVNKKLSGRLMSYLKSMANFSIDENSFGTPITRFNNIPILELGSDEMPITEADDTATTALENTTSMYVVSLGEQNLSLATNSGIEYWEHTKLEAKEAGRERWEIRASWKCENPYAITRVRNIKL